MTLKAPHSETKSATITMIYLDNNATTRVDPEVVAAMAPFWSKTYFNPSSPVGEGSGSAEAIRQAKKTLAKNLGGVPAEYVLTSGATESNNWVIKSITSRCLRNKGRCHIVTSEIEHPSVLDTLKVLKEWHPELKVNFVPVTPTGEINLETLRDVITQETDLVSIMFANNESGVIQPISLAGQIAKAMSGGHALFHTDATQAVGRIPVDLDDQISDADLLSLSAHKFHGPKGVGALYSREGTNLDPFFHGGSQQFSQRAGTENPALAAGLEAAVRLAGENLTSRSERTAYLRDTFENILSGLVPKITILGQNAPRLPNTSLLLLPGMEGDMLVHQLLELGIATSTGSACSNGSDQPSHVVRAMGISFSNARNVVRISMSHLTTMEEVQTLCTFLKLVFS